MNNKLEQTDKLNELNNKLDKELDKELDNELNSENIIWSKGFLNTNYTNKKTEVRSKENEIIDLINNSKEVIFIKTGSSSLLLDLDIFSKHLDKLKQPIILITTDGDRSVPSSYKKSTIDNILNNEKVLKWYTQNYDRSIIHPKLNYYPIGFSFHSLFIRKYFKNINDTINFMIECRNNSPINKRIKYKILSDTHNSITHKERITLFNIIKDNKIFNLTQKRLEYTDITKEYNKYNFVLSPRGNGLDCHRTWELFMAGVIIITKTSSLDKMYIDNNLPVVILNSWSELNNIDNNKIDEWYNLNIKKTEKINIYPKLKYKYWLK